MRIRRATLDDVDGVFSLASDLATSFDVEKRPFSASFQQILTDEHALLLGGLGKQESRRLLSRLRAHYLLREWQGGLGRRDDGDLHAQKRGRRKFVDNGVREVVRSPGSEARCPGHATGGRFLPGGRLRRIGYLFPKTAVTLDRCIIDLLRRYTP